MNRMLSRCTRVGLVLVATASLLQGGPADAQSTAPTTLGGYQGAASASGLHAIYNPAGLLPLAAPVDLGVPDALATIASGPSTFARASAADPGDILANPDTLMQLGAGPDYEPGTVPSYPYRVSASNGVGEPSSEVTPAPGLNARVAADDSGSSAEATMPQFIAPAIATAGSAASTASTSTDGSTVTLHAVSSISDFDLLGILAIDSIVTDLTATSDGTTTMVTGGTVVTGAFILGSPVTIDSSGVQGAAGLTDLLTAVGATVTVAGPVQQGDGATAGQLTAAGLRIDFELSDRTFPVLGDVVDLLPPLPPVAPGAPSGDDLLALLQARHLTSIHVAGATVALTARPTAPRAGAPAPAASTALPAPAVATPSAPSAAAARPVVAVAPAPASLVSVAPATSAAGETSAVGLAEGIGVLAVLALLLQPLFGDGLARGAALLTTNGPADACPREGT